MAKARDRGSSATANEPSKTVEQPLVSAHVQNLADLIKSIRSNGEFTLSADSLCSELHLAIFLGVNRRAVIDALFYPDDGDGIPFVRVGSRKMFSVRSALATIDRMAKPQKRPRRRGGARLQKVQQRSK